MCTGKFYLNETFPYPALELIFILLSENFTIEIVFLHK